MSEREQIEQDAEAGGVPKILVIAGPYDAEKIRARLAEAGFEVLVFNGHDQPVTHATNHQLQCVVLSLRLSGIEPNRLLQELRQALGSEVPIVLLAGRINDALTLEDALEMGASQLARRPLDPDEVLAKVEEVLQAQEETGAEPSVEAETDGGARGAEPDVGGTPAIGASTTGPWQTGIGAGQHDGDTLPRWKLASDALEQQQAQIEEPAVVDVPIVEVDLPLSGELDAIGVPTLLDRIRRAEFTGSLTARRDEATKAVYFDGGLPVLATSSSQADRIEQMLLRDGKLSPDQCETCQQQHPGLRGLQMGEALVERGLLRQDEVFVVTRRHVAEIIYSLFAWTTGQFVLDARHTPPSETVRLGQHPRALVLEGIRRKYRLDQLVELVGTLSTRPAPASGSEAELAQAELSDRERQALMLIDGERTLQTVIEEGPLDQLALYQLLYGLSALGLIQNTPARPKGNSGSELAIDRQRVLRKYAQVCEGNYFVLLGVSPDASRHEVVRACDDMKAAFDPYRVPPEIADEFADQLGEIIAVIEEARRVLADDDLLEAYRETLS